MICNLHVMLLFVLLGELESTVAELEESNRKLASLKAEKDAAKRAIFPVLNVGNKQVASDGVSDKKKELQDMESTLKDLMVFHRILCFCFEILGYCTSIVFCTKLYLTCVE